jgi:hypothetical protein
MEHVPETLLNAYLDDVLKPTERKQVETHLAECSHCHDRLQELQLVFDSLAGLPEVKLERDLTPEVLDRLPLQPVPFARTRGIAVQWGVVLGVSLWSTMQVVGTIKLPSPQLLTKLILFELPVLSLSTLQIPTIHLPRLELPSLSLPAFSSPGFSLPAFNLPFTSGQMAMVTFLALVLWAIGNFTLLRSRPHASS